MKKITCLIIVLLLFVVTSCANLSDKNVAIICGIKPIINKILKILYTKNIRIASISRKIFVYYKYGICKDFV